MRSRVTDGNLELHKEQRAPKMVNMYVQFILHATYIPEAYYYFLHLSSLTCMKFDVFGFYLKGIKL